VHENSDIIKYLSSNDRIKIIKNILMDNLDLIIGKDIADLGAGEGSITKLMADYANKIFAVDNNENMLALLKEKCENLKNVYTILSASNKINIENNYVDVVISISSFHDLPVGYENEMDRILKNNGVAIILDWKKEKSNQGPPYDIRLSEEIVINKWNKLNFSLVSRKDYNTLYLLVFKR